jgi:hypothetical protein
MLPRQMNDCPRCTELAARMEAALEERDRALLELARAREGLNAAQLREEWKEEQDVPLYPLEVGAALPVPLRYRLADVLNRWAGGVPSIKRRLRAWVEKSHGH